MYHARGEAGSTRAPSHPLTHVVGRIASDHAAGTATATAVGVATAVAVATAVGVPIGTPAGVATAVADATAVGVIWVPTASRSILATACAPLWTKKSARMARRKKRSGGTMNTAAVRGQVGDDAGGGRGQDYLQ